MKNILKFKLNTKYRDPISIEAKESIFRGRDSEVNRLKDIAKWRKSAAVLVSGVRGVGKTSFVREALRRVREDNKNKSPVVELTFANLSPRESEDLRLHVLKTLIRGLYLNEESRDKLGDDLENMYDKTYYSELKDTGLLEVSRKESTVKEEKKSSEKIYKLDLSPTLDVIARVTGSVFSLGVLLNFLESLSINVWWQLLPLMLLGAFIVLIIMSKFEFRTVWNYLKGFEETVATKLGGSRAAKYDLSADTLEAELKQVLMKLHKSGRKAIFVIDELDKLDEGQEINAEGLKDHEIYKVIRIFKNLFSLSGAVFVFITSESFYDLLEEERESNPYSTFHTIFTDRIFLPSLYYQDVEKIIESFVDGDINKEEEEIFKRFKRYISWKAKNHIFDTHNLIEDYTSHNPKGQMFVRVYEGDELHKGNIEEYWEEVSALQTYIAATYDEKRYPTEARKNEMLYLTLREVCELLYQEGSIEVIDSDFLGVLDGRAKKRLRIDTLEDAEKEDFSGAIEDLLLRTERFDFTSLALEKRAIGDPPEEKNVEVYTVKEEYKYPSLGQIRKKAVKTEFENNFLIELSGLGTLKFKLTSLGLNTFDKFEKEYESFVKISTPIKNESSFGRKRKSEILVSSKRIRQIKATMKKGAILDVVNNVAQELGLNPHDVGTSPAGSPMWNEDSNLAGFYQYVGKNLTVNEDYVTLSNGADHLMIGFNLNQAAQDEYAKTPLNNRRLANSTVINVISSKEITNKPMVWRVFRLEENLRNLGSLSGEIKRRI